MILIATAASIINGCYALLITELFPAGIRYSGLGVSYSIGVAIFGGLGPFIFSFLTNKFQSLQAPYYYLLACILLTAIAVSFIKTSNDTAIESQEIEYAA